MNNENKSPSVRRGRQKINECAVSRHTVSDVISQKPIVQRNHYLITYIPSAQTREKKKSGNEMFIVTHAYHPLSCTWSLNTKTTI